MRFAIAVVGLTFLVVVPKIAWTDEQPAKLSAEQQAKIKLIRDEIRAQIRQLEGLERKLIAAVIDEKREPARVAPRAPAALPMAGAGLIGRAVAEGRDSGFVFQYEHGKVFNPEAVRSRIKGDFVLSLRGQLELSRDMVIEAWHAGGGVSHDVNTLFIDDRKISSVGDDRSKHSIEKLDLKKGVHTIRWELTGGTFRNNLLKLIDPETGKLLPLGFAKVRLPDLPTKEVVHVGTDERGWPIPADW